MNSAGVMNIQYTCLVDTPFALALYLLKMDCDAVSRTFFCVGKNLSQEIVDLLPYARRFHVEQNRSRIVRLLFRLKCFWYNILFIRGSEVYGQDHLVFSSQLICRKRYTLIEDGPRTYSMNKDLPGRRMLNVTNPFIKAALYVLNGPIYLKSFGRNGQCKNRWVTTDEDADLYQCKGMRVERLDVGLLWQQASKEKKAQVLRLFDGEETILDIDLPSKGAETILLTQPIVEDCGLSEEEFAEVYRDLINNNLQKGVVIKPHPRDKLDYERIFPNCKVIRTRVPMQLLCAFGMNFKRAITICSTSISDFPAETEIVWIGNEVNAKILKAYGHVDPPRKFRNVLRVARVK